MMKIDVLLFLVTPAFQKEYIDGVLENSSRNRHTREDNLIYWEKGGIPWKRKRVF